MMSVNSSPAAFRTVDLSLSEVDESIERRRRRSSLPPIDPASERRWRWFTLGTATMMSVGSHYVSDDQLHAALQAQLELFRLLAAGPIPPGSSEDPTQRALAHQQRTILPPHRVIQLVLDMDAASHRSLDLPRGSHPLRRLCHRYHLPRPSDSLRRSRSGKHSGHGHRLAALWPDDFAALGLSGVVDLPATNVER